MVLKVSSCDEEPASVSLYKSAGPVVTARTAYDGKQLYTSYPGTPSRSHLGHEKDFPDVPEKTGKRQAAFHHGPYLRKTTIPF